MHASNLLDRLGVIWQTGYIPVKVLPELDRSLRKSRSSWEPSDEPHALKLERQMLGKWRRNVINENPSKKNSFNYSTLDSLCTHHLFNSRLYTSIVSIASQMNL